MEKADSTGAHSAASPTPSELEWAALEREAAAHSRGHWGPLAAWLAHTPWKTAKGKLCSGTDREKMKKKKYTPRGTRQILFKKKDLYLREREEERKGQVQTKRERKFWRQVRRPLPLLPLFPAHHQTETVNHGHMWLKA